MGDAILRQPLESEALSCADLVIMSAPELFRFVYGESGNALRNLFVDFVSTRGTTYSRENIIVNVAEGNVRGLILTFPVSEGLRLMKGEIRLLRRRSGGLIRAIPRFIFMAWRMFTSIRYPTLLKDELFISDLAVFPEYRGQGVSRSLLIRSQEAAAEAGLAKLSLFVETDNRTAISVYEKFGFRRTATQMLPRLANRHGLRGFHKMVMDIDRGSDDSAVDELQDC